MARGPLESDIFTVLSHPARRAILIELQKGSKAATSLGEEYELSASALSQHLKILKDAALVSEVRDGRQRIYQLNAAPLREIADWVETFETYWTGKLDALGKHLRKNHEKRKNSV
jgi:DNA-binding transcriptional ArsR family regulator